MVQKLGKDAVYKELEFTEGALEDDAKNYHAWSHRQVLLSAYLLFVKQIEGKPITICLFFFIGQSRVWCV